MMPYRLLFENMFQQTNIWLVIIFCLQIFLPVAFFVRTLRNLLYHLFWWEKKEYRFDRMFVHLEETDQGRKWLFGPISLVKWILLVSSSIGVFFIFYPISQSAKELWIFLISLYLINLLYTLEAIKNILELRTGWKIPPLKPRNIGILLLTSLSLCLLFKVIINSSRNIEISFLVVDKLLGPLIALLILISNKIFLIYKRRKIIKATIKIKEAKHLKIIGVTGSYGKTTTKELIAQILSQKYRVLKTPGSQNTDIGIAESILGNDLSQYDFFVCEMAAYHRGEIASICEMLKPKIQIGVITGINEQHQSLFGSLENTQMSKFELIEAIEPSGYAIFNGRSKNIDRMISWAKQKKLNIKVVNQNITGELPAQLHGKHFQENLSLAITTAYVAGVNKGEITKGILKVKLPAKTMNIIDKGSVKLIDDTFNANPDGVYAALDFLRSLDGKKILVLQPLIELGKYASEVHRKIGKMAAEICDEIILTNKNFNGFILKGVKTIENGTEKVKVGRQIPHLREGVILFEGKEAEKLLKLYRE